MESQPVWAVHSIRNKTAKTTVAGGSIHGIQYVQNADKIFRKKYKESENAENLSSNKSPKKEVWKLPRLIRFEPASIGQTASNLHFLRMKSQQFSLSFETIKKNEVQQETNRVQSVWLPNIFAFVATQMSW